MIAAIIVSIILGAVAVGAGLRIGFYAWSIRDPKGYLIALALIAGGGWLVGNIVIYA